MTHKFNRHVIEACKSPKLLELKNAAINREIFVNFFDY